MDTMKFNRRVASTLSLALLAGLLVLTSTDSYAQRQTRGKAKAARSLSRAEIRQAQARLVELGYGSGSRALVVFQKYERRKVSGRLNRDEFDAIMNADAPRPKDPGYKHVEVDIDRQVLLVVGDDGSLEKILPVSTGSNKPYREKGGSGLAYTPRGRFRVVNKIAGWRESPLGLLYYPSYFSGGVAIHGNPSVPITPQSHGCVRIPMSEAVWIYKQLPVGTIVLVYDDRGFVSAKDWAAADRREKESETAKDTR